MYVSAGNPNVLHDRIVGHADNSSGLAGEVGEYLGSTGVGAGLTSNQVSLVSGGAVNLSPGDWELSGSVIFTFAATTSYTYLSAGFSWIIGSGIGLLPAAVPTLLTDQQSGQPVTITSALVGGTPYAGATAYDLQNLRFGAPATVPGSFAPAGANSMIFNIPATRVVVSPGAPTPFPMGVVALAVFTVSTISSGGSIRARRAR